MRAAIITGCVILLVGCATKYSGLAAVDPKPRQYGVWDQPTISSLTPTLRWERFPRPVDVTKIAQGQPQRISDVRYDLLIWERRARTVQEYRALSDPGWVQADPVITGLRVTQYTVPTPLKPHTEYLWTVRVWYRLDGRLRLSQWSRCGSWGDDLPPTFSVPEYFAFYFLTPKQ